MWTASTKTELNDHLKRSSSPVILVPTMGALHSGHAALIELAREKAGPHGTVLVSIFVNPIQFDRIADLEKYPRTLEADFEQCAAHGVDGVFHPNEPEIYAPDRSVTVVESQLSRNLCGASRPGHFDGVCTIVLKLFNITRCHAAVFGEKDFQQLAIIRRMIRDLDLGVTIITHPTIREPDGLAMSSRNIRLSAEHRADAPRIGNALLAASKMESRAEILEAATSLIGASQYARIDYLSLVDPETLEPATALSAPSVLACAVFYGEVRLIDHLTIAARSELTH